MEENPCMKNRTVLQVIPALETGGAERTAIDVAAAVAAAGGRALVASAGGRMVAEIAAAGAIHISLPLAGKNPVTMAWNVQRLAGIIKLNRVDLVHARSRAPAWSAMFAARLAEIPFVTTYHGAYAQENRVKGFYNSVMARGDAVIANSHYIARLICERNPFAKGRITVIHRGSDLSAFARDRVGENRIARLQEAWGISGGDKVIVQMARLTHWKGQTVLIDALARLAESGESGWTAILAGDDQGRSDYTEALRAQIEGRGLAGRVKIVGHCRDVPAAMALADAVAVASIEPEAFGRSAVEAQAAGVPVVVADCGAVHETVLAPPEHPASERTGWRVPPGDARALGDALATLLCLSREDRDAMAARARRHVEAHFSLSAMTGKTLDVYRRVLGNGQPNGKTP